MATTDYDRDRGARRQGGGSSPWLWVAGLVILGLLLLFLIPLFGFGEGETAGPNIGTTLCDVTDNPQEFYGNTVTVSGEVAEVRTANAFVIGGDDFIGGCSVLVVGVDPVAQLIGDDVNLGDRPAGDPLRERDVVQVTGTMRVFNIAEVEDEIGADLADQDLTEFEGQPALVARNIALNPRVQGASDQPQQGAAGVALADITDNPEEFFGNTVAVDGIVAETIDPRVFVIVSRGDQALAEGEGFTDFDRGVLVVNAAGGGVNLQEGMTVGVNGTVREFELAAAEQAVGGDLEDGLFTGWAGRPAIFANQVQPR